MVLILLCGDKVAPLIAKDGSGFGSKSLHKRSFILFSKWLWRFWKVMNYRAVVGIHGEEDLGWNPK